MKELSVVSQSHGRWKEENNKIEPHWKRQRVSNKPTKDRPGKCEYSNYRR